jgi:aspartyl-tRNA synthetase
LLAEEMKKQAGPEEPLYTPSPLKYRSRPGTASRIHPLAESGELLKNAPSVKGDYFKVANIIE